MPILKVRVDKEYGVVGNEVHERRCGSEVLQSVFRFGREGRGARVYVKTGVLPGWVPTEEADGVRSRSKAEKAVIEALPQNGELTVSEITQRVDYTMDTVRKKLRKLQEENVVEKQGTKKGTRWKTNGLSDLDKEFAVDIETEDINKDSIYSNVTVEENEAIYENIDITSGEYTLNHLRE